MKRIIPFMSIICFVSAYTFAQSDANAVKLLKAISNKYNGYKTMTMDISLTIENMENKSKENRNGKILVKGNKFNLNLDKQQIISDNKTIWTYLKDANEVQINKFDPKEEMITPDKIFKIAEKDYASFLGEKINENGKTLQIVELTPNDKSASFSKIKLYVNTADNSIVKGVVYDKNAIHYTYAISNFKSNAEVSDASFVFDKSKYPGIEVIDLRE